MAPTRRRVVGAVAAAALAGCLENTADGGTTDGEPTTTDGEPRDGGTTDGGSTATGTDAAVTVSVSSHPELGDVLVGPDGMTAYMFDNDTNGEGASTCQDGCADQWPPLTVEGEPTADEGVTASLGTFERGDGSTQVTANGWPLYGFASDEEAGDAAGQGVGDVWWVLAPDGTPIRGTSTATPTDGGY